MSCSHSTRQPTSRASARDRDPALAVPDSAARKRFPSEPPVFRQLAGTTSMGRFTLTLRP